MLQRGGRWRLHAVRHNDYSRVLLLMHCAVKLSGSPETGDLLYIYCRSPLNTTLFISTDRMYWFRRHTCHIDCSTCNVQYTQTRANEVIWTDALQTAWIRYTTWLPHLVGPGSWLVCESVGKADLLSDHFDSKQSMESVDLLVTCHPSPSLITFAFRSSEVKRLLL